MSDGSTNKQTMKIPVGDMAKTMLHEIFPHLTREQIEAMKAGKPVPPSPDWIGSAPVSIGPIKADTSDQQARIQELNQKLEKTEKLLKEKIRIEGILDGVVAAMADGPLVSAIMLFSAKDRMRRARKAVNQFIAQSYPKKQLVIVNATDADVTTTKHKAIKELKMEISGDIPSETLGMMRNFGMKESDGALCFPHWDDDDVYDRHLLAYLVQKYVFVNRSRNESNAVALSGELRLDIEHSVGIDFRNLEGIPGTMLFPLGRGAKYPDLHGGEGEAMWSRYWAATAAVCPADWPLNTLKMSVYDGNNVAPVEQFMFNHVGKEFEGRMFMDAKALDYVRTTMEGFGVSTEARQPNVPTQPLPAPAG